MDSAGYAADNLKTLKGMRWLMRVPEILAEAKRLVRETGSREAVVQTQSADVQLPGICVNRRQTVQSGLEVPSSSRADNSDHHYAKRDRPSAEDEPEIVGYGLRGNISAQADRGEAAKRNLGKFIIATHELDSLTLSAVHMLSNYTDQGISSSVDFASSKSHFSSPTACFSRNPSTSWL